jgi:hypothetical protein
MTIRDEFSVDETKIRSGFDEAMKAVKACRECMPIDDNADELCRLRGIVAKQRRLLAAVKSSEFVGIWCDDVDGKNWFDLRESCLKST